MRELNMDTQRQNFWKESINNEVTIRNKWFQQHMDVGFAERKVNPAKQRKTFIKVQPLQTKELPSKPAVQPTPDEPTKTKPFDKAGVSEMRVPSPGTKTILYTGLSAEGDGRKAYLLQRKNKGPEEKYEYPLTSALEVGWNVMEVSSKIEGKPAQFGRSRIVQDTFYRTNGVL